MDTPVELGQINNKAFPLKGKASVELRGIEPLTS